MIQFETSSDKRVYRVREALGAVFEALAHERPAGVSVAYWQVLGTRRFIAAIELDARTGAHCCRWMPPGRWSGSSGTASTADTHAPQPSSGSAATASATSTRPTPCPMPADHVDGPPAFGVLFEAREFLPRGRIRPNRPVKCTDARLCRKSLSHPEADPKIPRAPGS
jgi:hypothetical protein